MSKSVRISDEDYKEIKKIAKQQKRNIQQQISVLLEFFKNKIMRNKP